VRSKDSADGRQTLAIIGGGPAGLSAAYWMQKHSNLYHVLVVEADDKVGGIARTESYKGYRFDIGGHRFTTRSARAEALWNEVLPEAFLRQEAPDAHLLSRQILRLSAAPVQRAQKHGAV
jgi:protoporphyrinogen oxidase